MAVLPVPPRARVSSARIRRHALVFALLVSTAWAELRIGWSDTDITPPQPVLIGGQFYARVSEGALEPITATVLALESAGEHAVWVSCDLVGISDALRGAVRERLAGVSGLEPRKVILHATHSHTGPEIRVERDDPGIPLGTMATRDVVDFSAGRIADAVRRAWDARQPGAVSYGLGHAVVGRNRRWVDDAGRSTMYGDIAKKNFSHIEGFEDHNVNVLATYDAAGALTGMVVNVACPAQVSESLFTLSADFWHETRAELRRRHGETVFVAAQCSAAGDIAPHFVRSNSYDRKPAQRMLELKQRTVRVEIAQRLANAVDEVLPLIAQTAERAPRFAHTVETLALPLNRLTEADVADARKEAVLWRGRYESEKEKIEAQSEPPKGRRWYVAVTNAHGRWRWNQGVLDRFERQQSGPVTWPAEVHVIRLGDAVFATNPFEYYLDYGIQLKARSPATQTFLVQLAGSGTYVPSPRSVTGGGYGSLPASNPVGPEGGAILRERTLELIDALWK